MLWAGFVLLTLVLIVCRKKVMKLVWSYVECTAARIKKVTRFQIVLNDCEAFTEVEVCVWNDNLGQILNSTSKGAIDPCLSGSMH